MASICTMSMNGSDVRCPVCGQGFLLQSEARTAQSHNWDHGWERDVVREQLRLHHQLEIEHPTEPFPIGAPEKPEERTGLHPQFA